MMMMLLALIPDASAIELKWWGAGPSLSTMLFPGEYPISFPAGAREGGKTSGDPLVDKVGFDLNLAGRGVIYPVKSMRLGARIQLGFGGGFGRQEFTLEYEPVLSNQGSFQVVGGVGLGVGHERFRDKDGEDFLDVSYYPIRGQIGGLLRDKYRAYELDLWATYHITGGQKYYSNADAEPVDGKGSALAGGALYAGIGLEFTVWFGDFKSDSSNNNNNKNNKSGKSSKSSKSGNGKKSN